MAFAYIDWSSQEFGIAAALSEDERMLEAYASGDPYLAFAKQAGAVPADATKQSHKRERDVFKTVLLGVGYGMEADALASRLGILPIEARELLLKHRETYPRFWRWSQNVVDTAMVGQPSFDGVRLAPPRGRDANPAPAELPHAGERRRNAADSVLLWH